MGENLLSLTFFCHLRIALLDQTKSSDEPTTLSLKDNENQNEVTDVGNASNLEWTAANKEPPSERKDCTLSQKVNDLFF